MSCILCLIKIASLIIIYNFLFIFCLNANLFIIICVLLKFGYMLVLMLVRFAYIGICDIFIFILNWRIILIFILVFLYICESVFLVMLVMIIFFIYSGVPFLLLVANYGVYDVLTLGLKVGLREFSPYYYSLGLSAK